MLDLASASCRVEFHAAEADVHKMAAIFAECVHEACEAARDGDGTPWWLPSTNWVALTAYGLPGGVSLWETLEASPGQIRVRHQGLRGDFTRLSQVARALAQREGVVACKPIPWSHRLTIDFQPQNGVADWFVDEAEHAFERLLESEARKPEPAALVAGSNSAGGALQVATGPARWLYFSLGASSLVMTVVGLIVPGIPTVPFLLLSSYGFARSSPRTNQWLRKTRFLGPILTEWEHHGGLSQRSKRKLIGMTVVIILIAVVLAPLSPVGLVLILVMASLSTYGVYRLPNSPEAPEPAPAPARLSMPHAVPAH